jgi:hypothetical protein
MYRTALFALLLAGTAHADDSNPPIRHRNGDVTVIMNSSMKPMNLVAGETSLGGPGLSTAGVLPVVLL